MTAALITGAIRAGARAALRKALALGGRLTAANAKAAARRGLAKITQRFKMKVKKMVSGTEPEDIADKAVKGMGGVKKLTADDDDGSAIYKPKPYTPPNLNMMQGLGDPPGGKPTSLSRTSTVIVDIQRPGYN